MTTLKTFEETPKTSTKPIEEPPVTKEETPQEMPKLDVVKQMAAD